jgi:hypothetical protein
MKSVTPPRLLPLTLLILMAWCGFAPAADAPAGAAAANPIPLAELGQRADAQQPAPAPVLTAGQATLAAPLQALRGEIGPAGLTVESTSVSEGGGRFRLTPKQLGKGGTPLSLPTGTVSLRDQAVVLDRGPLTEVLSASGDGLRQDFVVAQAPAGEGPLTLSLALEGATASADPAGVALTLPGGRRLAYGGLHITDAGGQVVEGTLAVADAQTLTITVADAAARYPLTIDPTISDLDWQVLNSGIPGANGIVLSIAYDISNGKLYVGGEFSAIGTVFAKNIAQWDGSAWSALGSGLDRWANDLTVSGTDLYVGGGFTTAGGNAANYIARWNGSAWSTLGSGLNDEVSALAVSGSDLYVGGQFTTAGGNSANYITKWDGSAWSSLGSGLNNDVYALAVSGSSLYVGGKFTIAGGNSANYIAKWEGSAWSSLGSGLSGDWDYTDVSALAVSGSDLYVGGHFFVAGGSEANGIAKWNGSAWSALGSGLSYTNGLSLAVSGSDLYVGGWFPSAGGTAALNIAKWNGSAWSALGSGLNDRVNALAVSGSDLYVGGSFTTAIGNPANYITKWDGSAWSSLGSGLSSDWEYTDVSALAVSGSDLYVGGNFTSTGGNAANHIAKWNGTAWTALGSGIDLYGRVSALAVSGNDLYVGGSFATAGGNPVNNIAKWDGSAWSALGSGLEGGGLYGGVSALAVSGRDLYVGGSFATAGGNAAKNIAKWDGSTWSALGGGLGGLNDKVSALAVSGNDLYVGGHFATAGGNPAHNIAKWDGSAWSALGSGVGEVFALAVIGRDLYVGGDFGLWGSPPGNNIAKWDGRGWSALGSGLDNWVFDLVVAGTNLYVGGIFMTAGGKLSPYVASFRANMNLLLPSRGGWRAILGQ